MTTSSNRFLQENQLINRIQTLERGLQQLRTAQVGGSDVLGPIVGSIVTAGTYALTTSFADVTNMSLSITPAVASKIIVAGVWDFNANGVAGTDEAEGRLLVDGAAQDDLAFFIFSQNSSRATVGQFYAANLTAAAHTIKMQAMNLNNARGLADVNTSMTYWLFRA